MAKQAEPEKVKAASSTYQHLLQIRLERNTTVLHKAVVDRNFKQVENLCAILPGLLTIADDNGLLPLHYAAISGDIEIGERLLDNKALRRDQIDAQTKQNKKTPLHYAAENGHPAFFWLLALQGANTEMNDSEGMVPRRLAYMKFMTGQDKNEADLEAFLEKAYLGKKEFIINIERFILIEDYKQPKQSITPQPTPRASQTHAARIASQSGAASLERG